MRTARDVEGKFARTKDGFDDMIVWRTRELVVFVNASSDVFH